MMTTRQIMMISLIRYVIQVFGNTLKECSFFIALLWRFIMTKFTVNGKEYTHKELNLIYDFFTLDQWDLIIQSNNEDEEIVSTIQQLWRASY